MPIIDDRIPRKLSTILQQQAKHFPVICMVGPRQSGKTTLVRAVFSDKAYVSLKDLDERRFASEDPRGFRARFPNGAVFDEVQRTPDLFSYIQTDVDAKRAPGKWILAGSQNFLIMEKISQSLAGRALPLQLLPLCVSEIAESNPDSTGKWADLLFKGFYPAIHGHGLPPVYWYKAYTQTYLERDVRQLVDVGNLLFSRFLRMCAARTGQLVNFNNLASESGISQPTAKRWLSA